jgi:Ca-activated chloride channel family protein
MHWLSTDRKTRGRGFLVVLTCFVLVSVVVADDDPRSEAGGSSSREVDDATIERLRELHYTESHEVRMVLLPTSVTDRKGRNIRDLDKDDFRLFDDDQRQEIRYFASEAREPISVAFLLDVSGSMRQMDKMTHAKEAIRFFVDQLRADDRFALICFADDQVAWVTEFTSDRWRFLRRLGVQEGYGQTALNDAIAAAPGLVDASAKGRKAIVLITDGVDNHSRLGIEEAVETARRVSVPMYTIGFLSVSENMLPKDTVRTNLEVLRFVSRETGGHLFAVHDPMELKEAVSRVDSELRHQYLLGYYPPPGKFDGDFHEIHVETDRRRLNVRTRRGYYGVP